jgi:hypothetical protein
MYRFSTLLLVGLALSVFSGCKYTNGYVHIDNATAETITVLIDGEQVAEVPSGKCKKVKVDLGDRHFVVEGGGERIYDATHSLDFADRPYHRPEFVLDPTRTQRYCRVEVAYGEDRGETMQMDRLASLVRHVSTRSPEENQDEDTRIQWEIDRSLKREFKDLCYDLHAIEKSHFFRIEKVSSKYVLHRMPSEVLVHREDGTTNRTLIRVPVDFHDALYELQAIESPTLEDLARMIAAKDIARDLVPFRE